MQAQVRCAHVRARVAAASGSAAPGRARGTGASVAPWRSGDPTPTRSPAVVGQGARSRTTTGCAPPPQSRASAARALCAQGILRAARRGTKSRLYGGQAPLPLARRPRARARRRRAAGLAAPRA
eukprot:scaffold18750_cov113-Isochrysis_galbana.AAC.4